MVNLQIENRKSRDIHSNTAVLLVGHGTRDASGIAEFEAVANRVAHWLPNVTVRRCFLEFAQPDIKQAIARLSKPRLNKRSIRRLIILPMMLQAAGHVNRDIPERVAEAMAEYPLPAEPGMKQQDLVHQAPHLGRHPAILKLSDERYESALAEHEKSTPASNKTPFENRTLLLMVGRGSSDQKANEQMRRFAQIRGRQSAVDSVQVCFTAMAQPSLKQALSNIASLDSKTDGFHRIVVQPHLLFTGLLLTGIRDEVTMAAKSQPQRTWIVTPHLGPAKLLAEAILDHLREIPDGNRTGMIDSIEKQQVSPEDLD